MQQDRKLLAHLAVIVIAMSAMGASYVRIAPIFSGQLGALYFCWGMTVLGALFFVAIGGSSPPIYSLATSRAVSVLDWIALSLSLAYLPLFLAPYVLGREFYRNTSGPAVIATLALVGVALPVILGVIKVVRTKMNRAN